MPKPLYLKWIYSLSGIDYWVASHSTSFQTAKERKGQYYFSNDCYFCISGYRRAVKGKTRRIQRNILIFW